MISFEFVNNAKNIAEYVCRERVLCAVIQFIIFNT